MKRGLPNIYKFVLFALLILSSTLVFGQSTETDILTISFAEETGPAVFDDLFHTVDIDVDYGTVLTNLVPSYTLSTGATSNPACVVADDYSIEVTITVTAED